MVDNDAATRMHKQLGYYLYIFPALLLAAGIIRSLYYSMRNARMNYAIDSESQDPVAWRTYPPSALSNWFKRTIQYPALFRGRHRKPIGWYTFPTRIETILVAMYWLLNIIFLVINRNQKGLGGKHIDSVKLIGDRAGTLALWNLPVFFLLAGRNDFLVWLTGWSYSMFHVFHKWIARCAVLMAVVHSLAYSIYMHQVGPEKRGWNRIYWTNGIAATTTMGVILVLSLFPFRKKAYEFFLFCHIICAVLFLVFLYHHLKLSKTNSYDGWIWACVSMWAFDRFARLLRVVILNARAFSSNPANHHLARAKFVKGTDIIQLTVYPSAEDVGYFPGAHFFVFLTGSWRFWECHPFTAADWRPSEPTLTGMPQRSPSGARSLSESLADSLNGSLSKEIGAGSGALRGGAVVKRSGSGRSGRSGSGRSGSGVSRSGSGVNRSGSGRSGVTRSGSGRSCRSGRSGVARSGSGRSKSSRSERERSRSERDRSRGGSRERTRLRGGEPSPDDLSSGGLGLRGGGLDIEDAEAILGLRGGDLHRQKSRNIYIVKQNGNQGNIFVVSDTGKGRPILSDTPGVGDIERTGTPRGGLERSKSDSTRKELAKAKIAKAQEVARAKDAAEKAKEAIRIYELTKARELAKAKAELEKFRKAVTPPLKDPESEKSPASPEADSERELPGEPPLKKEKEPSRAIKEPPPKPESSKRKPKRTHSKTETKEERAAAREKRAEKRRKRLAEKDEESETEPETGTEDTNAGVLEKYVPDLRGIDEDDDDDDVDPEKLALELALGKDGLDDDDEDDEGMSIEKELEMLKQRQREEAESRRRAIQLEEEQGDLSQILLTARTTGSVNRPPGHGRGPPRPKLTFLIKPRKGMTATLAGMIRENDEAQMRRGVTRIKELEIKCLIEGAYGINRPMHLFETAVVIAGGVGVTTILPYLADFVNRSRGAGPENRTLTRRFVFVWTAREEELVENVVVKRFPKGVLNREDVSLQLYVTKKKAEGEKKLPGVRYRRPNIPEILATERKMLVGRMAVLSCGPSVLVDITRNAVVECLTQERKHVQYFEESYGW